MLRHRPWILLGQDIKTQYEQCEMEGRDVALYKPIVDAFCQLNNDQLRPLEDSLEALYKVMDEAPMKADYPFCEPSDLDGIFAACPAEKPALPAVPEKDALMARLKAAWNGRIAGCLLGKPVEGWRRPGLYRLLQATDNFPLNRYIRWADFSEELVKELGIRKSQWADLLRGEADEDDDTNYTTFALKLIEVYGRDFTPDHVLACWANWIPMSATCTAERVAYRNAAMGLLPPETATYKNPYREWIGAQIRGTTSATSTRGTRKPPPTWHGVTLPSPMSKTGSTGKCGLPPCLLPLPFRTICRRSSTQGLPTFLPPAA